MAAGDLTQGRRRDDVVFGELPDDVQPGDYWRYVTVDGEPMVSTREGNLTGTAWGFRSPGAGGIGTLTMHTVREHADGTASIRPNDGSSNSVLITGGPESWHGYLEHGVWREV